MARARQMEQWNHTATLMAHLVNINSIKGRAQPRDFHPFGRKRQARSVTADDVTRAVVGAYCNGRKPVQVPASAFSNA